MEELMTPEEINQRFEQKVRRGMFKPVARLLTNITSAEDRLQDAICQVWWMFRRYAVERGQILDDAILVQKCRWHACDLARQFVPGGRRRRSQDVLDPRAYRDGHVTVHRLDLLDTNESPEGESPMEVGLAEAEAACPERKWNSALDLESWIGGLSHRDRGMMEMTMAGHELTQTAHELGLPYLHAWRHQKQLGHELAQRAGVRIAGGRDRRRMPHGQSSGVSQTA
jgi:hypothetical protein